MPNFLSELLSQLKAIWARLDGGQRLTIVVVLIATVAGLSAVVWFAGRPDYTTVFTASDMRSINRAAQALDNSVEYDIEGQSIVVKTTDLAKARIALNSAGIGGGSGSADELGGVMSDRVTRMHALSRRLEQDARTKLLNIRGVLHAQVSHSKPKRSPYRMLDPETAPRANVDLQIQPGIDFRAVARIAVKVASAALGVPEDAVTVTNLATLATFSPKSKDGGTLDTDEFLGQQRQRASELTDRAQSMLGRVYGDKAIVRVTVDLDPAWQITKERSAPSKQLIKRTMTTKEDTKDGSSAPQPAALNDPNAVGTAVAAPSTTQSKQIKETEYAAEGFVETSSGKLAPDIRKISVAVVVDKEVLKDTPKEEIEKLIGSAIGFVKGRDEITIHEAAFPEITVPEVVGDGGTMSMLKDWAPAVGQVIAVVLVLLFLKRLLKANTPALPAGRRGRGAKAGTAGAGEDGGEEEEVSPEEATRRMRKEIERAINEDPGSMSRLLETWLTEAKS